MGVRVGAHGRRGPHVSLKGTGAEHVGNTLGGGGGCRNVRWRWLQGEIGDLFFFLFLERKGDGGATARFSSYWVSSIKLEKAGTTRERIFYRDEGGLTLDWRKKVCVCVCVCVRACVRVCVHVCMCACMCVCVWGQHWVTGLMRWWGWQALSGLCPISNQRLCWNQGIMVPEGRCHLIYSYSCGTVNWGLMRGEAAKHRDGGNHILFISMCVSVCNLWDWRDKEALYKTWLSECLSIFSLSGAILGLSSYSSFNHFQIYRAQISAGEPHNRSLSQKNNIVWRLTVHSWLCTQQLTKHSPF